MNELKELWGNIKPSHRFTIHVMKDNDLVPCCRVDLRHIEPLSTFRVGGSFSFRLSRQRLEWIRNGHTIWHFTRDPWGRAVEDLAALGAYMSTIGPC